MIKYYVKKGIAYGIMFIGIMFGILAEPVTENKYGLERMVVMFASVLVCLFYNSIIEGRMQKHGRCQKRE